MRKFFYFILVLSMTSAASAFAGECRIFISADDLYTKYSLADISALASRGYMISSAVSDLQDGASQLITGKECDTIAGLYPSCLISVQLGHPVGNTVAVDATSKSGTLTNALAQLPSCQ